MQKLNIQNDLNKLNYRTVILRDENEKLANEMSSLNLLTQISALEHRDNTNSTSSDTSEDQIERGKLILLNRPPNGTDHQQKIHLKMLMLDFNLVVHLTLKKVITVRVFFSG